MFWAVSALGAGRGTRPRRDRHAFTLIEVLVATGLTLLIMAAVAGIFVLVSDNIADARATIEMTESLRATQFTLQKDLSGLTARGVPPLDPALGLGYIEIIEGPVGPCAPPDTVLVQADGSPYDNDPYLSTPQRARSYYDSYPNGVTWDTTVGDYDDILQFTTRSDDTPFTGRGGPNLQLLQAIATGGQTLNSSNASLITETQSNVAEISWFLRGRTLYRRVLLVDPTFDARFYSAATVATSGGFPQVGYFQVSDVSVRQVGGPFDPTNNGPATLVANSLGDLTKRENRYGHPPMIGVAPSNPVPSLPPSSAPLIENWPHDARYWGPLRLPTLRESSDPKWPLPFFAGQPSTVQTTAGVVVPQGYQAMQHPGTFADLPIVYFPINNAALPRLRFDAWQEPRQWEGIDPATGGVKTAQAAAGQAQAPLLYPGTRYSDDVILTNVVGFDVKVWDPGAPIFQRRMRVGVQDGGPEETITVAPGDANYYECLKDLFSAPTNANFLPVAYGAFVDLGWAVDPKWVTFNASDTIVNHLAYPPTNNWPPNDPKYRAPEFHHPGNPMSGLWGVPSDQTQTNPSPDYRARVYDTGSSHYERDGIAQDAPAPRQWDPTGSAKNSIPDEGSDGLDNNGLNGIDDVTEREAPPPYDAELKAIQIKIRVIEPDSRQVREVTVVQDLISQ